jgi:hypothetical protein
MFVVSHICNEYHLESSKPVTLVQRVQYYFKNVYSFSVVKYWCIFNLYVEKPTVILLFSDVKEKRKKIKMRSTTSLMSNFIPVFLQCTILYTSHQIQTWIWLKMESQGSSACKIGIVQSNMLSSTEQTHKQGILLLLLLLFC